jgi:hypothetical protein
MTDAQAAGTDEGGVTENPFSSTHHLVHIVIHRRTLLCGPLQAVEFWAKNLP